MQILERTPYYSISEDEGTIQSNTKVLHNVHLFDFDDWKYKSFFLRYFDTESKDKPVLVAHWKETFTKFKLKKTKVAAFVSDMALFYVPKEMSYIHVPCSVHLLDLCLEDN